MQRLSRGTGQHLPAGPSCEQAFQASSVGRGAGEDHRIVRQVSGPRLPMAGAMATGHSWDQSDGRPAHLLGFLLAQSLAGSRVSVLPCCRRFVRAPLQ